ncbi:MAG: hypothetical protein KQH59_09250 [Desulfobulbaceae bacterium]|nr:hypothetical protein [Desulfobulbaceae bacterium]
MTNWKLKATIADRFGKQWRFAQELGIDPAVVSRVVTGAADLPDKEKSRWARKLQAPETIFNRESAAI